MLLMYCAVSTAWARAKFNPAHFREYDGANVMNLEFAYKYNKTLILFLLLQSISCRMFNNLTYSWFAVCIKIETWKRA